MSTEATPLLSEMVKDSFEGNPLLVRLPPAMEKNKMAMLRFLSGAVTKLDEHFNSYFPLVGFIAKKTHFRGDETKEARNGFYLGLALEDGTILQTTSEVVANALDSFRTVMGEFPQDTTLWVHFQRVKATAGHSYRLTPIEYEEIPENATIVGEKSDKKTK